MAAIQIERLTRRHGPVAAVDGVDLAIGEGEFFALVGPSGCGKTSLLRLIAGLDPPDEGRIRIGDLDVTGAPPWDRPVNTVFQSYALFPHLSAGDNVASFFFERLFRQEDPGPARTTPSDRPGLRRPFGGRPAT